MPKNALKTFITTNPWQKFTSLLLASALWFFVVSRGTSFLVMDVPIGLINIPAHLVVSDGQKTASLSIKGHERVLKNLRQGDISLTVDLSTMKKGSSLIPLSSENVRIPNMLSVSDISPQSVKLVLEEKVTKTVPVRANIVGSPALGLTVERISILPKEISVVGTESKIAKIKSIKTEPINISGITNNLRYRAYLDLSSVQASVTKVDVDITLTETH